VADDSAIALDDFDRNVEEHDIPEEEWQAAFARWIAEKTDGPVPSFRTGRGAERRLAEQLDVDARVSPGSGAT
jgi:hypothetical protein